MCSDSVCNDPGAAANSMWDHIRFGEIVSITYLVTTICASEVKYCLSYSLIVIFLPALLDRSLLLAKAQLGGASFVN